jgi:hypothetical protein
MRRARLAALLEGLCRPSQRRSCSLTTCFRARWNFYIAFIPPLLSFETLGPAPVGAVAACVARSREEENNKAPSERESAARTRVRSTYIARDRAAWPVLSRRSGSLLLSLALPGKDVGRFRQLRPCYARSPAHRRITERKREHANKS